jgi:hypothetical protein
VAAANGKAPFLVAFRLFSTEVCRFRNGCRRPCHDLAHRTDITLMARVLPAKDCSLQEHSADLLLFLSDRWPSSGAFRPNVCRFRNGCWRSTQLCLFSVHKISREDGSLEGNSVIFIGNAKAILMSACTKDTDAAAQCTFCGKKLPIVNGELQPWRAPNGQFFCNEFCADDAEEVRFRRHGKADRKAHERDFFF